LHIGRTSDSRELAREKGEIEMAAKKAKKPLKKATELEATKPLRRK